MPVVVHLRDMRVVESPRVPGLGPEAFECLRVLSVFRAQQLYRDEAPQHLVGGVPYLAYAPCGDPPLQAIAVAEHYAP